MPTTASSPKDLILDHLKSGEIDPEELLAFLRSNGIGEDEAKQVIIGMLGSGE